MAASYYIKAIWDAEAGVWTSQSDVHGLVIETSTLAEFESLALELAPDMLAANVKDYVPGAPLLFTAERALSIA